MGASKVFYKAFAGGFKACSNVGSLGDQFGLIIQQIGSYRIHIQH